jgi:hypothetical protein
MAARAPGAVSEFGCESRQCDLASVRLALPHLAALCGPDSSRHRVPLAVPEAAVHGSRLVNSSAHSSRSRSDIVVPPGTRCSKTAAQFDLRRRGSIALRRDTLGFVVLFPLVTTGRVSVEIATHDRASLSFTHASE